MAARSKLALQQVVGFLVMWKGSVPRRGLLSGLFASLRDRPLLLSCSHFVCVFGHFQMLGTNTCDWPPPGHAYTHQVPAGFTPEVASTLLIQLHVLAVD